MPEAWGPSTQPVLGPQHNGNKNTVILLGVLIGVLALVVAKAVCILYLCKRRKRKTSRILRPEDVEQQVEPSKEELEQVLLNIQDWGADCSDIKLMKGPDGKDVELGSGGFGRVVKGLRNGVQAVAVKMVYNTDEKARQEFIKEIKLLHRISRDSNIVQFFGANIRQKQLWLVTEYMDGGDLRKALTAEPPNNLTWWNGGKEVALDVARGLAFLHSNHVIHRDLKSKNILLTANGTAKIGDVGMAKILTEGELTRDQRVGTFAWAAPELLCGERCTEKADIYSFGLVVWEIVTGMMPIRGEVMAPSAEECPASVTKLIQECMRVNPDLRPSATELYRRLQACEANPDMQPILDSAEAGGNRSSLLQSSRAKPGKVRRVTLTTSPTSSQSMLTACRPTPTTSLSKPDSLSTTAARVDEHGWPQSDSDSCIKTGSSVSSRDGSKLPGCSSSSLAFMTDSSTAEALRLQEEEMMQGNTAFAQLVASYIEGDVAGLTSGKNQNRAMCCDDSLAQDVRLRDEMSDLGDSSIHGQGPVHDAVIEISDDSCTYGQEAICDAMTDTDSFTCQSPIRDTETETETDISGSTVGDLSSTYDHDVELGLRVPRSKLGIKMAAVANAVANAVEMSLRKQDAGGNYLGGKFNDKTRGGVGLRGDDLEEGIGQTAGKYLAGWRTPGFEECPGKQRRLRTW